MLYVLFALLAGLAWGLWFILEWAIWIPILATGIIALIALVVFIVGRAQANRSAALLEQALAQQGVAHAQNLAPARRAEVEALQKQIADGIAALKQSRLGGKKRGRSALYALPWYAIIGPPGVGKTTALRHSGLVFPYADTAVRGVGGTRNCDWWFTNDAILLDTAGRYATEAADQGEWLAFLDMLKKYRSDKPLNGLIVAVALPDVIDANEAQLEEMGTKLRGRIDEVMTRLKMVLPVYFLLTKCDLVAGFSEFFGDLRKSERAQAWGATFSLKEDKRDPRTLFHREFDVLTERVHARAIKRLAGERDWRLRQAIYHFPLEFGGIRRNVGELVARVFADSAFQATPNLRGFYFSSGTQEGTPLGRVLQRMGAAMGIRPQQLGFAQQVESKSYFLHDVFMRVVFPDADVAARSPREIRRQRLVRVGVSVTAFLVAITFSIPSIVSFGNNRDLLQESQEEAEAAAGIDWEDGKSIHEKLDRLLPVHERLRALESYDAEGVPFSLRFLMYSGDEIERPLLRVFIAEMQEAFVKPCKYHLEGELGKIDGKRYPAEREMLRTYLMLSHVKHIDVDWATGRYVALWAALNEKTSSVPSIELKKKMEPLVRHYFELIKEPEDGSKPKAAPVAANGKVVESARAVLQAVPVAERYYAMFVTSLEQELYDPSGDALVGNMQFPPVTLDQIFEKDRPDVLVWLKSKRKKEENKYYAVPGPYTEWGHLAVLASLKNAESFLAEEAWVVPLTEDEAPGEIPAHLARLVETYQTRYIAAWEGFLSDLVVEPPVNLRDAVDLYEEMQRPERPYLRLLRRVEDHTQFHRELDEVMDEKLAEIAERKVERNLSRRLRGLKIDLEPKKILGKTSRIPGHFSKLVYFGVPKRGSALNTTPLSQFFDGLEVVRKDMRKAMDDAPDASTDVVALPLRKMTDETVALVDGGDAVSARYMGPLLLAPLRVGGRWFGTGPER